MLPSPFKREATARVLSTMSAPPASRRIARKDRNHISNREGNSESLDNSDTSSTSTSMGLRRCVVNTAIDYDPATIEARKRLEDCDSSVFLSQLENAKSRGQPNSRLAEGQGMRLQQMKRT